MRLIFVIFSLFMLHAVTCFYTIGAEGKYGNEEVLKKAGRMIFVDNNGFMYTKNSLSKKMQFNKTEPDNSIEGEDKNLVSDNDSLPNLDEVDGDPDIHEAVEFNTVDNSIEGEDKNLVSDNDSLPNLDEVDGDPDIHEAVEFNTVDNSIEGEDKNLVSDNDSLPNLDEVDGDPDIHEAVEFNTVDNSIEGEDKNLVSDNDSLPNLDEVDGDPDIHEAVEFNTVDNSIEGEDKNLVSDNDSLPNLDEVDGDLVGVNNVILESSNEDAFEAFFDNIASDPDVSENKRNKANKQIVVREIDKIDKGFISKKQKINHISSYLELGGGITILARRTGGGLSLSKMQGIVKISSGIAYNSRRLYLDLNLDAMALFNTYMEGYSFNINGKIGFGNFENKSVSIVGYALSGASFLLFNNNSDLVDTNLSSDINYGVNAGIGALILTKKYHLGYFAEFVSSIFLNHVGVSEVLPRFVIGIRFGC